jgi:hypothetical protein
VIAKHTKLSNIKGTVFDRVLALAERVRKDVSSGSSVEVTSSRVVILNQLDVLRSVMNLKTRDKDENAAKGILLRACYQAEQKSTFGAACLIESLCEDIRPTKCRSLQRQDFESCLGLLGSSGLSDLLKETIVQAGSLSTINVKETEKMTYSHVTDSIDIPVTPIGEFGDDITLSDCRFLAYDGVIERVSEINSIIERCSSEKSSLVIYARGYGYEVVATLLHNWRVGKLRVIPVSARADDIQNFWFMDLPALFTQTPAENGLRNYENLLALDRVTLSSGNLTISDRSASSKAITLRERISKDSAEMGVEKNWVEERTRRLSSRKVEIVIGSDYASSKGVTKDRIGTVIRYLSSARVKGVVERDILGKAVWVPVAADMVGRDSAHSLRRELQTSTLVVQDE